MSGSDKAQKNLSIALSEGGEEVDISATDYSRTDGLGFTVFVGTGGDIVLTVGGDDLTYKNIPDGSFLPVLTTKVVKLGTTAGDMVAQW